MIEIHHENIHSDVAFNSVSGGKVKVFFMVDKQGKTTEIYMNKSVEFVLDEEAIRVIRESPLWIPAYQNGREVNAYCLQPITFFKE